MIELAVKLEAGTDKCMGCRALRIDLDDIGYCILFDGYPEASKVSVYRLDACKKAEIKEIR